MSRLKESFVSSASAKTCTDCTELSDTLVKKNLVSLERAKTVTDCTELSYVLAEGVL